VQQSGDILSKMGADVVLRRHVNRPHTITCEEIELAKQLIREVFGSQRALEVGFDGAPSA
jgi:hypothetical protein